MSLPRHHIHRFCESFLIRCTAWVKGFFFSDRVEYVVSTTPTRPGFPSDPVLIFAWWQPSDVSRICLFTLAWSAEPWPTNSSAFIWQSLATSELCYLRRKKITGPILCQFSQGNLFIFTSWHWRSKQGTLSQSSFCVSRATVSTWWQATFTGIMWLGEVCTAIPALLGMLFV